MRHDSVTEPLKEIIVSIRKDVVRIALDAAKQKLPTKKNNEVLYKTNPKEGFDCSGFVSWVLEQAFQAHHLTFDGQELTHTNDFMDKFGVYVQWAGRKPGDIIILSYNGYRPSHAGIIVSSSEYVHASPSKYETVVKSPYELSAVNLKPGHEQIYFQNPIAIKRIGIRVNDWMLI